MTCTGELQHGAPSDNCGPCALDVIIEAQASVSPPVQDGKGLVCLEVLKLYQGA